MRLIVLLCLLVLGSTPSHAEEGWLSRKLASLSGSSEYNVLKSIYPRLGSNLLSAQQCPDGFSEKGSRRVSPGEIRFIPNGGLITECTNSSSDELRVVSERRGNAAPVVILMYSFKRPKIECSQASLSGLFKINPAMVQKDPEVKGAWISFGPLGKLFPGAPDGWEYIVTCIDGKFSARMNEASP